MFTELILSELGITYSDILKKKHGSARAFTYGEAIDRIVGTHGVSTYSLFPEIGEQTYNRMMKKGFPDVKLNGGEQTWQFYFLSLISHKYCGACNTIKSYEEFTKDRSSSTGVHSRCKDCRSIEQEGSYKKYYDSHQKSYQINYGKIRERQNKYKGERSLRVPSWSQFDLIADFYAKCPVGMQVDHVIPLKGTHVSGLHVLENLQYLSIKENLTKGNRYLI